MHHFMATSYTLAALLFLLNNILILQILFLIFNMKLITFLNYISLILIIFVYDYYYSKGISYFVNAGENIFSNANPRNLSQQIIIQDLDQCQVTNTSDQEIVKPTYCYSSSPEVTYDVSSFEECNILCGENPGIIFASFCAIAGTCNCYISLPETETTTDADSKTAVLSLGLGFFSSNNGCIHHITTFNSVKCREICENFRLVNKIQDHVIYSFSFTVRPTCRCYTNVYTDVTVSTRQSSYFGLTNYEKYVDNSITLPPANIANREDIKDFCQAGYIYVIQEQVNTNDTLEGCIIHCRFTKGALFISYGGNLIKDNEHHKKCYCHLTKPDVSTRIKIPFSNAISMPIPLGLGAFYSNENVMGEFDTVNHTYCKVNCSSLLQPNIEFGVLYSFSIELNPTCRCYSNLPEILTFVENGMSGHVKETCVDITEFEQQITAERVSSLEKSEVFCMDNVYYQANNESVVDSLKDCQEKCQLTNNYFYVSYSEETTKRCSCHDNLPESNQVVTKGITHILNSFYFSFSSSEYFWAETQVINSLDCYIFCKEESVKAYPSGPLIYTYSQKSAPNCRCYTNKPTTYTLNSSFGSNSGVVNLVCDLYPHKYYQDETDTKVQPININQFCLYEKIYTSTDVIHANNVYECELGCSRMDQMFYASYTGIINTGTILAYKCYCHKFYPGGSPVNTIVQTNAVTFPILYKFGSFLSTENYVDQLFASSIKNCQLSCSDKGEALIYVYNTEFIPNCRCYSNIPSSFSYLSSYNGVTGSTVSKCINVNILPRITKDPNVQETPTIDVFCQYNKYYNDQPISSYTVDSHLECNRKCIIDNAIFYSYGGQEINTYKSQCHCYDRILLTGGIEAPLGSGVMSTIVQHSNVFYDSADNIIREANRIDEHDCFNFCNHDDTIYIFSYNKFLAPNCRCFTKLSTNSNLIKLFNHTITGVTNNNCNYYQSPINFNQTVQVSEVLPAVDFCNYNKYFKHDSNEVNKDNQMDCLLYCKTEGSGNNLFFSYSKINTTCSCFEWYPSMVTPIIETGAISSIIARKGFIYSNNNIYEVSNQNSVAACRMNCFLSSSRSGLMYTYSRLSALNCICYAQLPDSNNSILYDYPGSFTGITTENCYLGLHIIANIQFGGEGTPYNTQCHAYKVVDPLISFDAETLVPGVIECSNYCGYLGYYTYTFKETFNQAQYSTNSIDLSSITYDQSNNCFCYNKYHVQDLVDAPKEVRTYTGVPDTVFNAFYSNEDNMNSAEGIYSATECKTFCIRHSTEPKIFSYSPQIFPKCTCYKGIENPIYVNDTLTGITGQIDMKTCLEIDNKIQLDTVLGSLTELPSTHYCIKDKNVIGIELTNPTNPFTIESCRKYCRETVQDTLYISYGGFTGDSNLNKDKCFCITSSFDRQTDLIDLGTNTGGITIPIDYNKGAFYTIDNTEVSYSKEAIDAIDCKATCLTKEKTGHYSFSFLLNPNCRCYRTIPDNIIFIPDFGEYGSTLSCSDIFTTSRMLTLDSIGDPDNSNLQLASELLQENKYIGVVAGITTYPAYDDLHCSIICHMKCDYCPITSFTGHRSFTSNIRGDCKCITKDIANSTDISSVTITELESMSVIQPGWSKYGIIFNQPNLANPIPALDRTLIAITNVDNSYNCKQFCTTAMTNNINYTADKISIASYVDKEIPNCHCYAMLRTDLLFISNDPLRKAYFEYLNLYTNNEILLKEQTVKSTQSVTLLDKSTICDFDLTIILDQNGESESIPGTINPQQCDYSCQQRYYVYFYFIKVNNQFDCTCYRNLQDLTIGASSTSPSIGCIVSRGQFSIFSEENVINRNETANEYECITYCKSQLSTINDPPTITNPISVYSFNTQEELSCSCYTKYNFTDYTTEITNAMSGLTSFNDNQLIYPQRLVNQTKSNVTYDTICNDGKRVQLALATNNKTEYIENKQTCKEYCSTLYDFMFYSYSKSTVASTSSCTCYTGNSITISFEIPPTQYMAITSPTLGDGIGFECDDDYTGNGSINQTKISSLTTQNTATDCYTLCNSLLSVGEGSIYLYNKQTQDCYCYADQLYDCTKITDSIWISGILPQECPMTTIIS